MSYPRKIHYTSLNISEAAKIANALGKNISTLEMLKYDTFIQPTNNSELHCIIHNDKSSSKMWCPTLEDIISGEWIVLD